LAGKTEMIFTPMAGGSATTAGIAASAEGIAAGTGTTVRSGLAAWPRASPASPLRTVVPVPAEMPSALAAMPAVLADPPAMGVKIISVFPANHGTGIESHQGFVILFEGEHGSPVALIDAIAITAIRTAAVSGLATRLLAHEDAGDLAILGSGTQARSHLAAMQAVRPLRRIRAWSPHRERLDAFVQEVGEEGTRVEAAESAQAAVDGADIICTVTASATPVVEGAWLSAGAHINAVGSSLAANRELDTEAVRRARLFVDRRESALNEAGDFLIPLREGAIGEDHIVAEIGEIAAGMAQGRGGSDEITLFKSLGLAIEDLASARWIHQQAVASGVGTPIPLG